MMSAIRSPTARRIQRILPLAEEAERPVGVVDVVGRVRAGQ